jgi:HEAT repeat protein
MSAVVSLGRVGTAEAAARLSALVESDDPPVRRAAAYALGCGKMAVGVEALTKALEDGDETVCAIAIEALGSIGPKAKSAVPALERLLGRTASSFTRYQIESALEEIRGE